MEDMKKEAKQTNKVRPLSDRVLIKELKEDGVETKTKSGIIIPVAVHEDRGAKKGEVMAVGPGRFEEGKRIPVSVEVGDIVLFTWGDKIIIDGEEYYIIHEPEVIATLSV